MVGKCGFLSYNRNKPFIENAIPNKLFFHGNIASEYLLSINYIK